jgi:hypothetical protein
MNVTTLSQAARERMSRWSGQNLTKLEPAGQDAAVVAALTPVLDRGGKLTEDVLQKVGEDQEESFQDALQRLATPRKLFVNLPDPSSVRQGGQPDCVLTSTAIALAAQRPYDIFRMLEETDKGYVLALPNGTRREGTLPTDKDIVTNSCAFASGLWMTVLSKELGPVGRIWRPRAIDALTGHGSDTDVLKLQFSDTTRKKLRATLDDCGVVLAGRSMIATDVKGLSREHSYAVLGYDKDTDTVKMQDPAGDEPLNEAGEALDGTLDGRFTVKLGDFRSWFSTVTYEKTKTTKTGWGLSKGKAHYQSQ